MYSYTRTRVYTHDKYIHVTYIILSLNSMAAADPVVNRHIDLLDPPVHVYAHAAAPSLIGHVSFSLRKKVSRLRPPSMYIPMSDRRHI